MESQSHEFNDVICCIPGDKSAETALELVEGGDDWDGFGGHGGGRIAEIDTLGRLADI